MNDGEDWNAQYKACANIISNEKELLMKTQHDWINFNSAVLRTGLSYEPMIFTCLNVGVDIKAKQMHH